MLWSLFNWLLQSEEAFLSKFQNSVIAEFSDATWYSFFLRDSSITSVLFVRSLMHFSMLDSNDC